MPECRCRTKRCKRTENKLCRTELFIGNPAFRHPCIHACPCPGPCRMSKSVLRVLVHATRTCPCCMSMLHVHAPATCPSPYCMPCPCCMFMSMLYSMSMLHTMSMLRSLSMLHSMSMLHSRSMLHSMSMLHVYVYVQVHICTNA